MRTRKEIEHSQEIMQETAKRNKFILEVLLDIRDLLAHPIVEITGEPMKVVLPEENI